MISGQGTSLQGATLTEGNSHTTDTAKIFKIPTVVECVEDGDILVTWKSGNTQTVTMTAGWVNPISCDTVQIVSGTWNIAWV